MPYKNKEDKIEYMKEYRKHTNELAKLRRLKKNPLVQKPCPNCGQLFEARKNLRKIFCSRKCVYTAYNEKRALERRARGFRPRERPRDKPSKIKREPVKIRKPVNLNMDSIIEIPCTSCILQNLNFKVNSCDPNHCEKLTEWLMSEANSQ